MFLLFLQIKILKSVFSVGNYTFYAIMSFLRNKVYVVFVLLLLIIVQGCDKKVINPENIIEVRINDNIQNAVTENIKINKGVSEITFKIYENHNVSGRIIVKINGNKTGEYFQTFDYKTGVINSECSMSYTVSDTKENIYLISYEGKAVISDIDTRNNLISGTYSFKVNPDNRAEKDIFFSGMFERVSF